ncbi:glycosyltransferase [Komagataeibacter medellinensis NBRC 3288]|uniref:Glycosyltransferase n=2 Tax=Komagataeibacter medellinensis TaxID=1177712 RepID=G2I0I9_KOMMN|nr:glycosyltransferase [Komagataeibacter medellinensis NBRC 3288]
MAMPHPDLWRPEGNGAVPAICLRHARHLTQHGEPLLALAWMERAARQAPDDRRVLFALAAARLGAGDGAGAADAVEASLAGQDCRAGLRLLVLACCMARAWDRAALALARFLTGYGSDPTLSVAAGLVCRHTDWSGWCALDMHGTLHWGGLPEGCVPDVWVDGRLFVPRRLACDSMALPRGTGAVEVRHAGQLLLGGRPERAALARVSGAVWPDDHGLAGWASMPARPEQAPKLYLCDNTGRRALAVHRAEGAVHDSPAGPATPVWAFRLEWGEIAPQGSVRVISADGRDLTGSPLPVRLPRAQPVFPAMRGQVLAGACAPLPARHCRIVVPVYADRARTLACLHGVMETCPPSGDGPAVEIMVVDDATPDAGLASALDALAAQGRITLRRHGSNRGYPAAINTALDDAVGMDVVLLNSDTLVAPGWLAEMLRVAYARADTGTVSPLSNDASILTWPDPAHPVPLSGGAADVRALMAASLRASAGQDVEIPTAHGFCMLIRHDCLARTGPFRPELYGRGYGEENDFSMRARLGGWRHRAALGVFVGHVGGVSFGAARTALQQRNLWVLNRLFPGYDALVQAHIAADPLAAGRMRLSLLVWHRAARQARLLGAVLLVTHGGAGGVARVVAERAGKCQAAGQLPVVLEPEGDGFRLRDGRPDAPCPPLSFAWPAQADMLVTFLRTLGVARIEIHHHMGHGARARALCGMLGVPYAVHVHDYAGICPRVTLVGPAGRYCGESGLAACRVCVGKLGSLVGATDVVRLRRDTARELDGAQRVVVPSADVATRLARYFPHIVCHVEALEDDAPAQSLHRFAAALPAPPALGLPPPTGRCRVVVAGGIGLEKGHGVLLAAARDARARDLALEFVVVGHTSDDASLLQTGRVFITGPYEATEAIGLLRGSGGHIGFVPSLCPETWCFTLTLLWRAGLRSVAFDLGAVAARIRATGRGACVPLGLPVHQLNTFLLSYAQSAPDSAPACS